MPCHLRRLALEVLSQPQGDTDYATWASLRDLFFDLVSELSQHQDTHGVQVGRRAGPEGRGLVGIGL